MSRPHRAQCTQLVVTHAWSGAALAQAECASLQVVRDERETVLTWEAPFYNDPAPEQPAGYCERLWDYEVVECFLADLVSRQYVEFEFGPHGHWLALEFSGYRERLNPVPVSGYVWHQSAERWSGQARITHFPLLERVTHANAYLVHGKSAKRCHHAAHGDAASPPDFHRIDLFSVL